MKNNHTNNKRTLNKKNYTAPYLDQISNGHLGSFRKTSEYKKLLIQPVQIPNLDHCGISSKLVSSQTDSNNYITPDGRATQTLRNTIHNVLPAIRKSYLEYQAKQKERKRRQEKQQEQQQQQYHDYYEDEEEYDYDNNEEQEYDENYYDNDEKERRRDDERYERYDNYEDEEYERNEQEDLYEDNSKELIKSAAEFVTEDKGYMGDDSLEMKVNSKKKVKKKVRRSKKKAKVKVRVGNAILNSNPKGYVL